ncbi:ChuX/HutX family heme-like substrate-binding protein [Kosakonia sp. BYX6]|uniref:ChuX/HutX family heme-like substrate-binding protein n=1 Tax=Kosakonia calanthes TaxID=3139408 RepID=A0ABZ3B244_9ENTR
MSKSSQDFAAIWQQYQTIKARDPAKYARDIARNMAISEAELTQSRIGHDAVRLEGVMREILSALELVGETRCICRNEFAVHEQTGSFTNLHLSEHTGLVLNPRALDLRLFMNQWASVFHLREQTPNGDRRSIQFFDHHGEALLKVYAITQTDSECWEEVVARFTAQRDLPINAAAVEEKQYAEKPDATALENAWRAMTDVHQFFGLLKKHNVSRQQAFRLVGDDLACQVGNDALRNLLHTVTKEGNEIMIFVSNRGCVQIFTGMLEKLVPMESWLNIFNEKFTLHLRDKEIHESWVTRKPTADGHVTSLELFAQDGTQIAQLYGQRSEGQPEQTRWRRQMDTLASEGRIA